MGLSFLVGGVEPPADDKLRFAMTMEMKGDHSTTPCQRFTLNNVRRMLKSRRTQIPGLSLKEEDPSHNLRHVIVMFR